MDLFIRNIPQKATEKDLYKFVLEGLKSWWPFADDPEISRCEIIEITDPEYGEMEFHGLITIRDPRVGEKAIRKLNGKVFMGSTVAEVREYTHRSPGDRRVSNSRVSQRPEDRRRKNLKIEFRSKRLKQEDLDLKPMDNFARQHGN